MRTQLLQHHDKANVPWTGCSDDSEDHGLQITHNPSQKYTERRWLIWPFPPYVASILILYCPYCKPIMSSATRIRLVAFLCRNKRRPLVLHSSRLTVIRRKCQLWQFARFPRNIVIMLLEPGPLPRLLFDGIPVLIWGGPKAEVAPTQATRPQDRHRDNTITSKAKASFDILAVHEFKRTIICQLGQCYVSSNWQYGLVLLDKIKDIPGFLDPAELAQDSLSWQTVVCMACVP